MIDSNPLDNDPFVEFEDWHKDNFPGKDFPTYDIERQNLSYRRLVQFNASLLNNREEWQRKMARFEAALATLGEQDAVEACRSKYEIHLEGANLFQLDNDYSGYVFPCSVHFDGAKFGANVRFDGAEFRGPRATFDAVKMPGGLFSFINVSFSNGFLSFEATDFGNSEVYFVDAHIPFVIFDRAKFSGTEVSFFRTKFDGVEASFRNIEISRSDVVFDDCVTGELNFVFEPKGRVGGSVSFAGADFSKAEVKCSGLHVGGNFFCSRSLMRRANFWSMRVDGIASFVDTRFGSIPDFRHTKLDRSPEVARMEVPEPSITAFRSEDVQRPLDQLKAGARLFTLALDPDDVHRLRKLKSMAIAANDHEKDGEFFAFEMMAKRGVEHTTLWQLLFNTIYWKVSFYGQSYLRPLGWLGASFATFAAIYSLMAALPIGGWQSLAFGITYSFKNSLPFLGTLTRSVPSPEGHVSWFALQLQAIKEAQPGPDWFTVLGTGQAMLSLFFFFFLLLGLRNKFRLK
ncbi:MAG: hypothetical protein AAF234_19435 [Pseudomonadota bacterium]